MASMRTARWILAAALTFLGIASPAAGAELLPPETPIEQAIDHYVELQLSEKNVTAAPPASDANLIRRTMLDLVGRPALASEAQGYVQSSEANKRVLLVDRLLSSPGFVRHQAAELAALLGDDSELEPYLAKAVSENRSWAQMFRELLLGEESDDRQQGAIRFVRRRADDLDKLTNDASVIFFGVNVSCAKCHDHPLVSDWSQDHYYGMYAFFSRTFENGGFAGERDYGQVEYKTTGGEMRSARPMFLTGFSPSEPESASPSDEERQKEKEQLEELKKKEQPPPAPAFSRRSQLVEAALAEDQRRYFARAMVNHQWKRFYGMGLVHPADQMHSENEPSHPELLDWLARDFSAHDFDLRRLTRGLVLSRAYGRTSQSLEGERPAANLFAVASVRPLRPRQYALSLRLANADLTAMAEPDRERRIEEIANETREFAKRFDEVTDDFQIGASEALLVSNSAEFERELIADGDDSLAARLGAIDDPRELATTAIWNVFGRDPEDEELAEIEQYLHKHAADRPAALKRIVWALAASSECRFNY
jgi:hypothetical protein